MLPKKKSKSYPNIVIMVLDAVRARNLSCYGYERKTSPNLDAFAHKYVLYENAIATSSWTLPSVSSIFTGLMPSEHGMIDIKTRLTKHETIAHSLQKIGYETVALSNVGWVTKFLGFDKGFDTFLEFDKYNLPNEFLSKYVELAKSVLSIRDYGARIAYDELVKWMNSRDTAKPFFLYVHLVETHFPYNPPRPYHAQFGPMYPWDLFINNKIKNREFPDFYAGTWKPSSKEWMKILNLYDGEIAYLDKKVGDLLDIFHEDSDDSLIFITADHGECLSEKRDLPVLQHQFGLYDDLIKVPLLVKYPENRNDRVRNQVQLSDIYGTICDVLGVQYEKSNRSLLVKEEHDDVSHYAISEYIPPENMLKRIDTDAVDKKYKQRRRSYRTLTHKYIESKDLKEFFDLNDDPLEYHNMYSELNAQEKNDVHKIIEETFSRLSRHDSTLKDLIKRKKISLRFLQKDAAVGRRVSEENNHL